MKDTDYELLWNTLKSYFKTHIGLSELKDTASVKHANHIELNNLVKYMDSLENSSP